MWISPSFLLRGSTWSRSSVVLTAFICECSHLPSFGALYYGIWLLVPWYYHLYTIVPLYVFLKVNRSHRMRFALNCFSLVFLCKHAHQDRYNSNNLPYFLIPLPFVSHFLKQNLVLCESRLSNNYRFIIVPEWLAVAPAVCRLLACDWSDVFRVEPSEAGDYQICFDNTFSRFSEKMVFFEVILDNPSNDAGADDEWAGLGEPENLLEYKLDDIKVSAVSRDWLFLIKYIFLLYGQHLETSNHLSFFSFLSKMNVYSNAWTVEVCDHWASVWPLHFCWSPYMN